MEEKTTEQKIIEAREEQRAVTERYFMERVPDYEGDPLGVKKLLNFACSSILTAPTEGTPLADRIKAQDERLAVLESVNKLNEAQAERISQLEDDLAALHDRLEEEVQCSNEGIERGANLKNKLTRAIGFFTAGPTEMAQIVSRAISVAMKDSEFKAYYDDLQTQSRQRHLEAIKQHQQVRELEKHLEELHIRLEKVRTAVGGYKASGTSAPPSEIDKLEAELAAVAQRLAETR